jgi:hypothetical protein
VRSACPLSAKKETFTALSITSSARRLPGVVLALVCRFELAGTHDRGRKLLRPKPAFNFQIAYLATVPADALRAPETNSISEVPTQSAP